MTLLTMVVAVAFVLFAATAWQAVRIRSLKAERDDADRDRAAMRDRFRVILDAEVEAARISHEAAVKLRDAQAEADLVRKAAEASAAQLERERTARVAEIERQGAARVAELQREVADLHRRKDAASSDLAILKSNVDRMQAELNALDEEANIESFGFYRPHYNLSNSEAYSHHLDVIRDRQKAMLKAKTAAVCSIEWTIGGSRSEGKKATERNLKLMLRAFNGECDAAIAKVNYSNVRVMEARITKSFEVINSLGEINQCRIANEFQQLKLEELYLAHEYEEKVQDEKEEQRKIREQLRDEEIARRQIERARLDAEREEERYQEALEKARRDVALAEGAKQAKLSAQIEELERRLAEAHTNKERAIAQAQLTKSGHVYVISNIGSFGEHVYKIGMTRRLDPLERIKELSDASVPFQFDIHAVIYSTDAPALEAELHRAFANRRVNRVNERKEFFRVTIDELVAEVRSRRSDIEVTRLAAAEEFRKTQAILAAETARIPIAAKVAVAGGNALVEPDSRPATIPVDTQLG